MFVVSGFWDGTRDGYLTIQVQPAHYCMSWEVVISAVFLYMG
jgi:hypothetical protein